MDKITLDYSHVLKFIEKYEIASLRKKVNLCHDMLHKRAGKHKQCLGWVDFTNNFDINEFEMIRVAAERIKNQSDVFIVVGIGGSYLGARAAIEMLNHSFYNDLPKNKRKGPKIYFAGHNMSSTYFNNLLDIIEDQDVCINVISKSGTTTEPAIAFRILKEYMENKYGKNEASKRIYVTTDKNKGALKKLADQEGYETFVVPDDIGGRYSVLTPVGLLPMAVAGIDIHEVIKGAKMAYSDLSSKSIEQNPSYQYAVIRNILYSKGKTTEILVNYEPNLFYFGEWFKQLLGESEGKQGKGIFPTSMNFVTDLHSMGQYVQQGRRNIFETVLNVEKSKEEVLIKEVNDNIDELNYLSGKKLDFINKKAMEGALSAHVDGGVPNLIINIPEISPYYFGYLSYFFMKACGMSGYLLGVNPFNQPGVEVYKRNLFKLLGKSGYEEEYKVEIIPMYDENLS
ncbi:glucose-6-phosphate isomerase [Alkaliphilus sp. MSJ-5]|uniref:Glucose-6-phosphate isomerase n=1 Tax=Alkaliphilus flagellatus TaxID=2841507 RepID=A0ABS6G2I2_9FIRM|nr:glucose-6-phosphate isomerase [Alkaliphilus flagellatus]MBU5676677.1 glucose-6-phosphate isomerase [Alkaliphilus flagellatus]